MLALLANYYLNKVIYLYFTNYYIIFGISYIILTFELIKPGTLHNISFILLYSTIAKQAKY